MIAPVWMEWMLSGVGVGIMEIIGTSVLMFEQCFCMMSSNE